MFSGEHPVCCYQARKTQVEIAVLFSKIVFTENRVPATILDNPVQGLHLGITPCVATVQCVAGSVP